MGRELFLAVAATIILSQVEVNCQTAGLEDCGEFVTISNQTVLTVIQGVVCFQCNVGDGAVQAQIFRIAFADISSDSGSIVDGILIVFNSSSAFQPSNIVSCIIGGDSASSLVFIREFQPPIVSGIPTILEGGNLSLDCSASNSQPLPSVAWYSPEFQLISNDRSLLINNMSRSEAGNYTCVATNSEGETQSSYVLVTVQFPPKLLNENTGLQLFALGATLELICLYSGVPAPHSVTWSHNGTLLMNSDTITILSGMTTTNLTKKPLMEQDNGVYTCNIENIVGSASSLFTVRIQVAPDKVNKLMVKSVTSESVLLTWELPEFIGFSPLTSLTVVLTNGSFTINMFMIEEVVTSYNVTRLQPLQYYSIAVKLRNQAGLEGQPVYINTSTASLRAPVVDGLLVMALSSTQLFLQWMRPVINVATTAPILYYTIEYYYEGGIKSSAVNVSGLNYTLEGLDKGKEYIVSVAAVTEAGVGHSRKSDPTQTFIDAPSPPQDLSANSTTPFSISVSWTATNDSGGRPLKSYRLDVYLFEVVVREEEVGADLQFAHIESLMQNTTYKLSLTAVNTDELTSQTVTVNVTTQPVRPRHSISTSTVIAIAVVVTVVVLVGATVLICCFYSIWKKNCSRIESYNINDRMNELKLRKLNNPRK